MTPANDQRSTPLAMIGALLAGTAVLLGAFAAHALRSRISVEAAGWWQTAVQYQMWHALSILVLGLSGLVAVRLPAWLMAAGTVIFAGTLYAMALGAPRWFGAVTPVGGLIMISGWGLLAWRLSRTKV